MAVYLSLVAGAGAQFFTDSGTPLTGGLLYTYAAGTTTPLATYTDSTGGTANTNPIVLNSAGRVPAEIWLTGSTSYKFVLKTATLTTIGTYDNISTAADISALAASNGSTLVTFLQAGTGAVDRTVQSKLRDVISVKDFNAVGDGVTDDTVAIQAALVAAAGKTLTFPGQAFTFKVTSALAVSSNTIIEGNGSTVRQYTANANVMTATSVSNVRIDGLTFYAVGSMSSTFNGQGLFASGCTNVDVINCTVTNHRGFGIMFYNSNYCKARGNRCINSPVSAGDAWSNVGGDIAIEGNSSYCMIIDNECISGNGVATQIQPLLNTDVSSYNIIANNTIANPKMYGVNLYLGDPAATMTNNVVVGNAIQNVTGSIYFTAPGTYPFGAGIYCNGGTDHVINSNSINGSNTAALSWTDNLAQGGIGVTNVGKCTINGNTIRAAGQYGITVRDPGAIAPATQQVSVIGNVISGCANISLQLKDRANVNIQGNQIYNGASHGIYVDNSSTQRYGISISNNIVDTVVGIGLFAQYMQTSAIVGNTIKGATTSGINVQNSSDITISANSVNQSVGTYGLYVDTTVARFTCEGNNVNGNNGVTYGLYFGARWQISISNVSTNCINEYGGIYVPYYGAAPASGTWVARDKVWNGAPTSANYIGWVCTVGGSPGTWETYGLIS